MSIESQLQFAGKRAEIWGSPSTVIDEAAGTVTVDTNEISGALNEALYSSQRLTLTRMRGWGLSSVGGTDVYTSPQKLAELKAAEEPKTNSDMLARLKRELPKDSSSLWKSDAVVKPDSDGDPMIHLDMIAYEDQPFLTDRVWRDANHLNKSGWQVSTCTMGGLTVSVRPPIEVKTYATAKDALEAEFNGESWVEQGEEGYRGEVTYRADAMSEADFRRVVQACYEMANKKGWKGSRPMRSFLQPLTGKTEFYRVVFVAPERLMQDA